MITTYKCQECHKSFKSTQGLAGHNQFSHQLLTAQIKIKKKRGLPKEILSGGSIVKIRDLTIGFPTLVKLNELTCSLANDIEGTIEVLIENHEDYLNIINKWIGVVCNNCGLKIAMPKEETGDFCPSCKSVDITYYNFALFK